MPNNQPYDSAGYTYQADNYCPTCITAVLYVHGGPYDGADVSAPPMSTEDNLTETAKAYGIDRDDESSFDSDDFPKVLFRDQVISLSDENEDANIFADHCGRCENLLKP